MKKVFKLLAISVMCLITAFCFVACGGGNKGDSDEPGIICKKFGKDDYYTVIGYNAEDGVSTLDVSAAAQTKYGDTVVVGRIKTGAFDGNSTLKEITVTDPAGDGVDLVIDEGAFKNIRALKKITLPFVGANAFSDAYPNETPPAIGDELKATDAARSFGYIFGEEESDFAFPASMNYGSGSATFYIPASLNEIVIKPQSEINIPMYAFCNLTGITAVRLDDGQADIKAIGESAFKDAASLSVVNIPASVKVIYASAFEGTTALKVFGENGFSVAAGSMLEEIKESAFKGTRLNAFDISGTQVAKIGDYAFYGSALTAFTFSAQIEKVGAYAFANSDKLVVNVPACEIGAGAFNGVKEAN